jgi:hypothetical protein
MFSKILGKSPKMQEIFSIIGRIARTTSTVLISGESGTGKELIARAIHYNSGRRGKFVSINCGSLPETLLESELLDLRARRVYRHDHEKKDSSRSRPREAIFLDEIGETSQPCRSSCCACARTVVRRVGSNETGRMCVSSRPRIAISRSDRASTFQTSSPHQRSRSPFRCGGARGHRPAGGALHHQVLKSMGVPRGDRPMPVA